MGRLPPHIYRTLKVLWRAIENSEYDHQQGIPKEHATRIVAEDGPSSGDGTTGSDTLPVEEVDSHLDFLQNHGEIYYVDDRIRVTDPEAIAADSRNADDTDTTD